MVRRLKTEEKILTEKVACLKAKKGRFFKKFALT